MIRINAKRVPKEEKRKAREKAKRASENQEAVPEERDLTKKDNGVARSMANPWAKNKKKDRYGFWTDFVSSNIDGIDYDTIKKQLWVRFLGGDVYTYFDVPEKTAKGFYSAPSKGHYFWEKIRRNPHIKYQKLTASRTWTVLKNPISLDSAIQKEANVKSVCQKLKKRLQEMHPELGIKNDLQNVFNGFEIIADDWVFDIVRYGRFLRLDIASRHDKNVEYHKTDLLDVQDVVTLFISLIEKRLFS